MMKIIALLLIAASCYVIYECWHIFGWVIVIAILINGFAGTILSQFIGSKSKTEIGYMFNPRELPKFLAILTSLMVGYYLYIQLGSKDLTGYEYKFAIFYIVGLILLPVLFAVYKLIRDRNDYVEITDSSVKYRDNDDVGEIALSQIINVEILGLDMNFNFHNGEKFLLKTSQMNFNMRDLREASEIINLKVGYTN